jgi:acyl carrier protein
VFPILKYETLQNASGRELRQAATHRLRNTFSVQRNGRESESDSDTTDTMTRGATTMKTALRRILSESARLDVPPDTLADDADLYAAGLSSLATVHLMLAIEDEFGIEIPDRMLTRRLFSSIDSMAAAVTELQQSKAAA